MTSLANEYKRRSERKGEGGRERRGRGREGEEGEMKNRPYESTLMNLR